MIANVTTVALTDAELAGVLARRNGNAIAEVERPTMPGSLIAKGSQVAYTGKTSGKTRTYKVGWSGICKRDGITPRLGLHKFGQKGPLFFVAASDCKLA
jgi:hypothetical protein